MPNNMAATVPMMMPSSTAVLRTKPLANEARPSTTSSVKVASAIDAGLPKSGAAGLPPPAHSTATGIRVTPIVVMTVPITSGGKNRNKRLNSGLAIIVTMPDTITAP